MKKTLYTLSVVLFFALSMQSCIKEDSVKLHGIEDISVSVKSTTKINAVLRVENTANRNISMSDIKFTLTDKRGNEIAQVLVDEELILPKKSDISLFVPAYMRLSNPILGLTLLSNLRGQAKELLVTGSVHVKMGCVKKNVKVKKMPLSEFMLMFEGSGNYIENIQFI